MLRQGFALLSHNTLHLAVRIGYNLKVLYSSASILHEIQRFVLLTQGRMQIRIFRMVHNSLKTRSF